MEHPDEHPDEQGDGMPRRGEGTPPPARRGPDETTRAAAKALLEEMARDPEALLAEAELVEIHIRFPPGRGPKSKGEGEGEGEGEQGARA